MLLAVDEYHPELSEHRLLLPQDICLEKTSIVKEKQSGECCLINSSSLPLSVPSILGRYSERWERISKNTVVVKAR